ncbi:hypothetical protein GCM10009721_39250 [Terrabacter tumescens]|uniref:Uncharacterized protein n=1 Tax=Terrabacter tumescens TaxID=60443 RepID=A0ABQ2IFM0_9MICO|nr:hypothetical protein GCM10009721_39250 [Terrabacter tumescens]
MDSPGLALGDGRSTSPFSSQTKRRDTILRPKQVHDTHTLPAHPHWGRRHNRCDGFAYSLRRTTRPGTRYDPYISPCWSQRHPESADQRSSDRCPRGDQAQRAHTVTSHYPDAEAVDARQTDAGSHTQVPPRSAEGLALSRSGVAAWRELDSVSGYSGLKRDRSGGVLVHARAAL